MTTTLLNIEGMTCEHCAKTVEGALLKVRDVRTAVVNLAEKKAVVTSGSDLEMPEIIRLLEEEGYRASLSL